VEEEGEGAEALGEVVGKRGSKRGSASLGVEAGEGCKKKPFSLMALSSASESREGGALDRSNGSGMRGVTGLRTSAGKSRMLGESMSGLRGEKNEVRGLMLRLFFREFVLRSYSLNCCFLFGTDFMGGMLWVGFAAGFEDACFAVSEDPVSIWTTCLNDDVSAWTNVVGYGLPGSDLATGFGDCSPCHGF